MRINEKLEVLYEYDHHFFSYDNVAKYKWHELMSKAKDEFKVYFDLENDDTKKIQREIIIPQNEWKFTKCKFKCELWYAGGDWEIPVLYFKCQLVEGYAFGIARHHDSGLFIYIPGKTEGNYQLVPGKDGKWHAPDNDGYKEGIDPKPNERDCWESLEKYLKKLVDMDIEKVRSERSDLESKKSVGDTNIQSSRFITIDELKAAAKGKGINKALIGKPKEMLKNDSK